MTATPPPQAAPIESPDRCPRCGNTFRCGAADPGPCACSRITLDTATLARLRERWSTCLCLDCLLQLSTGTTSHPAGPDPR